MKTTLITGASGGIGEAVARNLASRNHNLLLVARNEQKLKKLCAELAAQHGILADYIAIDLSEPTSSEFVFDECCRRKLFVNVLINNAGFGSSGEFTKNDLTTELAILHLNNQTMVALCHLFLPMMIANKDGSIINVGSLASFFPSPYMAVYAASKAFVRSFTLALTQECTPYEVFVMLFCPGLTTTNFMQTPANNNDWGKVLISGAYTQTAEQVADELIQALEKKKNIYISGRKNRLMVRLAGLIPGATVARVFANRKRKQMGQSL